jgi:hypothetical protein
MPLYICISYEASWQNSFLDGSNDEPLPKKGRNFVGSMTRLKEAGNFKRQPITINTVMGILCRLIGDQRKLYQARKGENYYFAGLEDKINFDDISSKKIETNELVFIRNMNGSTDQNSFTGMIRGDDKAFASDFSKELWGVLFLELEELFKFIQDRNFQVNSKQDKFDPLTLVHQFEKIGKMKKITVDNQVEGILQKLRSKFSSETYETDDKGQFKPIVFYLSALYLQIERVQENHDLSEILTKKGGISGVSKKNFTKKDFMDRYTTGKKKLIFGNPYILKEKLKGHGEVTSMLTKSSGVLDIKIDIPNEKASELKQMIEYAGVSSF